MKSKTENSGVYTVTSRSIYNTLFGSNADTVPSLNSLLLKYKTSKENSLPSKELALRRAGHQGNRTDIEYLVNDYDADIHAKSNNGFTALDWAYLNNHMDAVNTLCWLGADQSTLKPLLWKYVSKTESEWPTKNIALSRAAERGNQDDLLLLINSYKADIHSQTNGKTPKELALLKGHSNIVDIIEEIEQKQFKSTPAI